LKFDYAIAILSDIPLNSSNFLPPGQNDCFCPGAYYISKHIYFSSPRWSRKIFWNSLKFDWVRAILSDIFYAIRSFFTFLSLLTLKPFDHFGRRHFLHNINVLNKNYKKFQYEKTTVKAKVNFEKFCIFFTFVLRKGVKHSGENCSCFFNFKFSFDFIR